MRLYCSDTYRVLRLSRVCGACIFSTGERGSLRRLVRRRIRDGSISAFASSCGSAIVLATPHAPPVRTCLGYFEYSVPGWVLSRGTLS